MISQSACFGNSSPEPILVPEGQRQTQSRQDDIKENGELAKGQKRVRFKKEPLINKPAGPSSQDEDVELSFSEIDCTNVSSLFLFTASLNSQSVNMKVQQERIENFHQNASLQQQTLCKLSSTFISIQIDFYITQIYQTTSSNIVSIYFKIYL